MEMKSWMSVKIIERLDLIGVRIVPGLQGVDGIEI